MPVVSKEEIANARKMDLLSYLRAYEPGELVRFSGETYCTRTHDSLKISNGKWYWFSQNIGGRSALDYLVKVKEMSFPEAVKTPQRAGCSADMLRETAACPEKAAFAVIGHQYKQNRGVSKEPRNPSANHSILHSTRIAVSVRERQ